MADDPNNPPPVDPPADPPADPPTDSEDANWTKLGDMITGAVEKAVEAKWQGKPGDQPPKNTRTGDNSKKTPSFLEKLISGN